MFSEKQDQLMIVLLVTLGNRSIISSQVRVDSGDFCLVDSHKRSEASSPEGQRGILQSLMSFWWNILITDQHPCEERQLASVFQGNN